MGLSSKRVLVPVGAFRVPGKRLGNREHAVLWLGRWAHARQSFGDCWRFGLARLLGQSVFHNINKKPAAPLGRSLLGCCYIISARPIDQLHLGIHGGFALRLHSAQYM